MFHDLGFWCLVWIGAAQTAMLIMLLGRKNDGR